MNRLIIIRQGTQEVQTKGELYIYNEYDHQQYQCLSLELPWRNNEQGLSCIPEGNYKAIKHVSPEFGDTIWIKNVPGRREILLHAGNYIGSQNPNTGSADSKGCILPGLRYWDMTGDYIPEIARSRDALHKVLSFFEFKYFDFIIKHESNL